jgi:hypothetical protein
MTPAGKAVSSIALALAGAGLMIASVRLTTGAAMGQHLEGRDPDATGPRLEYGKSWAKVIKLPLRAGCHFRPCDQG